jgi:hypothetical protein
MADKNEYKLTPDDFTIADDGKTVIINHKKLAEKIKKAKKKAEESPNEETPQVQISE